ncbi:MAG: HEAT repeat domain-containing protein, partial [Vicinamibacteria bacterium]
MTRQSRWPSALALALAATAAACASVPEGPIAGAPPTFDEKMVAILQLEDRRILRLPEAELPPPVPPVPGQRVVIAAPPPDILSLLTDGEAQVRRRAALAAGRVGLPEAIGPLTAVLTDDPEPEIRLIAAFAMGLIGDASAAEPLLAALEDPDPRVEARAAEALGLIGHRDAAAAIAARVRARVDAGALASVQPDDLAWPQAPEVEVVRLGAYALVRLGDYDALTRALLDAGGRPVSQWWPVAYAFQRIGSPDAVPVLLDLLASEGQLTRSFAARGLGASGDTRAVAPLVAIVEDAQAPQAVRVQAVRGLAALGAAEAGPAVARLLTTRDTSSALRLEATAALGRVGGDIAVDLLIDLLTDPAPAIRGA